MTRNAEYELLEEIGQGACATVHRAHDMALKRDVAVKELSEQLRQDARQLRRLLDGARFLAGFSHDHLVQVHGLDEKRGWIVMELMRGGLDARAAQGPLPADLTRSVLRQALGGLQYLHRQGKLHGAIKPANLLINDEGRVKLSDAVCLDAHGEIRKPSDNAKYLAPELIDPSFGEVGPGTDLYCLGLTALELLKGPGFDAAFQGAGAVNPQMTWLRLHGSPTEHIPSARDLVPGVPGDLGCVIDRLLAKKVSERYSSAAEALKDLDEGELLPVDVPTAAARPAPPPRPATQVVPLGGSPPPLPEPPAPPLPRKNSPILSPASPAQAFKPWSKEWINHKLSDKRVLYPLLGVMLLGTLVFLFWPEQETEKPVHAHVATAPASLERMQKAHKTNEELAKDDKQANEPPPKTKAESPPPQKPDNPPPEKHELPSVKDTPPPLPPKHLRSSIDMELVLLQPRTFWMGSAATEEDAAPNERPRHRSTLSQPFYMGAHEVTQEQYEKVMGQNPSLFTREKGGGPRHPVEGVSWNDAVEFCRKLSELPEEKKEGRRYRLPTEAEWEYACRADTTTPFNTGDSLSATQACIQGSKASGDGEKGPDMGTTPVGSYPPNAWGLYDMHGNVWEWCQDYYSADAYARTAEEDPRGPRTGSERVIRGGSWQSEKKDCRSARRLKMDPDLANVGTGFRVVLTVSGKD